ncbi:MAG TPA: serine hydrolase, partial [Verrucomicrobiae bacterium]|nr:serine hydrolase [Verrucomicrobiae bacterium]
PGIKAAENELSDADIKAILRARIDDANKGVGIVVGLVDEHGSRIISYGTKSREDREPVDGDTLFEIGWITKVFTGTLLADMVERGEVKLDDPVSKYLPASVKLPTHHGHPITLAELATHTSGLPRWPDNASPREPEDPFADYTAGQLYEFLSRYQPLEKENSPWFTGSEIINLDSLAAKLKQPPESDRLSQFLRQQLSSLGRDNLSNHVGGANARLAVSLAVDFNRIIRAGPIYDASRFAGIKLSDETLAQIKQNPQGRNLYRLNRALLLEAYPAELSVEGFDFNYSHLGMGLLGHALALKAGTDYEALLKQRVCAPLGLADTTITLTPRQRARLAGGYDESLKPAINWNFSILAGAGAVRSTVNDLLKFLSANLGLVKSDLGPAMQLARTPRQKTGPSSALQIGLGWQMTQEFGSELLIHNGGTAGYHSFIGLDPKMKRGVVVLANSANNIDDIGLHLLEKKSAVLTFQPGARERVPIFLSPDILDPYAGCYKMKPGILVEVRRDIENRLLAQIGGQGFREIFPETETNFFMKDLDIQFTFQKSDRGQVTGFVLRQNGVDLPAKKIE